MAFEVEGILPEPPYKIVFNRPTRIFTMHFKNYRQIEMDCPIDDEMLAAIGNKDKCALSCVQNGTQLAAALVNLEQQY